MVGFPDTNLNMTSESEKRHLDENGRRLKPGEKNSTRRKVENLLGLERQEAKPVIAFHQSRSAQTFLQSSFENKIDSARGNTTSPPTAEAQNKVDC